MIKKLCYIIADGTVPYDNQALEESLLASVVKDECCMYLWQNRKTVVIGRNQNAWQECDCERLQEDGGYLARRLSGGGAVFHDEGNLNFTFVTDSRNYDVEKQTGVILQAVRKLGIPAERTGRNDITANGRKFSGNAYFKQNMFCLHHGTLLLRSSSAEIERYLTVSKEKLQSKSVASVRSRVVNLCEFLPQITTEMMRESLLESFGELYGLPFQQFDRQRLDPEVLRMSTERFASWNWKYGRKISFTCENRKRFVWGEVTVQLRIDGGYIADAALWSDALDTDFIPTAETVLKGAVFSRVDISDKLSDLPADTELQQQEKNDILEVLLQMV